MSNEVPLRARVFTDLAMASTNTVVGKAINIRGRDKVTFQMQWSGTPTGTFSFRLSAQGDACTSDGTVADAAKFNKVVNPTAFAAQQPAGSASGETVEKGLFTFADLCGDWLLPVYTNASGSGTGQGYGVAQ